MLRKEEKNMGNIEIKTREEKKQREKAYYEEAPQIGGRRPSRIRQQINRGMTVFVIVAACILFYFALLRLGHISDVIFKIIDVLKPVLYGCVIASPGRSSSRHSGIAEKQRPSFSISHKSALFSQIA